MSVIQGSQFGLIRDFSHFVADKPQIYTWLMGGDSVNDVRASSQYEMYTTTYTSRSQGFGPAELAHSMVYLAHYFNQLTELQKKRAESAPGTSFAPIDGTSSHFEIIFEQTKDFYSRIDMIKRWESTLIDDDNEELRERIEVQKQQLGHDSAMLREALTETIDDLKLFCDMRVEKVDDPSNALAEYLIAGYEGMRGYVVQATEGIMPQRIKNLPVKQVQASSAELDSPIPRASATELSTRLRAEQPVLYDWMSEQGWTPPNEVTASKPIVNTQIWRVRNEIEGLVTELGGLNKLATELLRQPSISAEEGRVAHAAEESRGGLHVITMGGETAKRKPYVDIEEAQRPYDIFTHGGKDTIHDKMQNVTSYIQEVSNKYFLLTNPDKRPHTSSESYEGADQLINGMTYRAGGIMRDAQTIARELNGFVEGQGGRADSQLLPMSLAASQFCRDEIYPRIRQNAWQVQELVMRLDELYKEQETGKKAPTGDGEVVTSFMDRRKQQMTTKIGEGDIDKEVT